MRILQINSTLNTGSTGRIAEEIGKEIITRKGESYVAYGRNANPSESVGIKIGSKWDQSLHLIHTRLFDTHGFHSTEATKKLIEQIQFLNPDIIHLHNLHGYYLNVTLLFNFLNQYSKPVIWTLHDCWAFTGHCCYYERIHCDKWKTECSQCELQFLYPQSFGKDNSKDNFNRKKTLLSGLNNLHLITVSKWLETQVKQSFLGALHIQTIYNGVDLSIFKPLDVKELKLNLKVNDKKIILGVANIWSEGKGLNSFLALSKKLEADEIIILIGLNKKQIQTLPKNIIGVERTQSVQELASFYNIADVFVNPSIAETFGMVTAEAMACGVPSVVYNSSAMPELVDEKTGFVVELGDIVTLYAKIKMTFKKGKQNYIENCRMRALQLFDKNTQMNAYLDLYNQLKKN